MYASKRPRLSDAPSPNTTSSTSQVQVQVHAQHPAPQDQEQESAPMFKASRTSDAHAHDRALLCTLPPTCNPPLNKPTPIADSRDLEIHYGKYHAHVCEQRGCGCVFPDARLLELHQTECHDPLAAVRKERGEKIFACHLASCPRLFSTPKARRLHLIQAHSYPKEYFFAVTNRGVGGLLKRWGDGASMIRGTWKPRDNSKEPENKTEGKEIMDVDSDSDSEEDEGEVEDEEDEEDGEDLDEAEEGGETPKARFNDGTNARSPAESPKPPSPRQSNVRQPSTSYGRVDDLAQSMSSLSLVPPAIRFGRGGKGGGFIHPEQHNPHVLRGNFGPRGRGRARIAPNVHAHTGHARGGRIAPDAPAKRGGRTRGFAPRGTPRGEVFHVKRGDKGRDGES